MTFSSTQIQFIVPLLAGMALDTVLGDPRWLPHPIRLFGNMISICEKYFNSRRHRKAKGIFVAIMLVAVVIMFFYFTNILLSDSPIVKIIFNTIFFFYAISSRSLIDEALKVERQVQKGDIVQSRKALSWIVGRDTSNLSFQQIRTATLETLAENLSDGVIAPLLFYAMGGVPLMMGYKMINTMDSMIGYKNERYHDFGWFSARILDDTANYIPSRLTALIMAILHPAKHHLQFIRKYARCHKSPNSGYPESALASILNCRFGGSNIYHGKVVKKPYIGNNSRDLSHHDFVTAIWVNIKTTATTILLIATMSSLFFL